MISRILISARWGCDGGALHGPAGRGRRGPLHRETREKGGVSAQFIDTRAIQRSLSNSTVKCSWTRWNPILTPVTLKATVIGKDDIWTRRGRSRAASSISISSTDTNSHKGGANYGLLEDMHLNRKSCEPCPRDVPPGLPAHQLSYQRHSSSPVYCRIWPVSESPAKRTSLDPHGHHYCDKIGMAPIYLQRHPPQRIRLQEFFLNQNTPDPP